VCVFVEENALRTRRCFPPVERSAAADRDLHGLEVFRADDPQRGRRHRCRVRLRLTLVTEAGQGIGIACEGKANPHPPPPDSPPGPPPSRDSSADTNDRGLAGSAYLTAGNDKLNVMTPSDSK